MGKQGIDISRWQGSVDLNKVKADGIQFCIFREGYRRAIDGQFIEYVKGAKAGYDYNAVQARVNQLL